jgi:hypothetical protein
MTRTKWMRLGVRDLADILRWVSMQDARELDDFRYRVIRGREFVSFRMVPRYAIQIGTSDIIVIAHVKPGRLQRLDAAVAGFCRSSARWVSTVVTALRPAVVSPLPVRTAELYQFALSRQSSLSRR